MHDYYTVDGREPSPVDCHYFLAYIAQHIMQMYRSGAGCMRPLFQKTETLSSFTILTFRWVVVRVVEVVR
jgi:hypothetical protein